MRVVIGYDAERHKVWSENTPCEPWMEGKAGRVIGGSAIEPMPQMPSKGPGSLDALRMEARRRRDGR